MKTLTTADWKKICDQRMAIRLGRSGTDVTGHAYGMYEFPDPKGLTFAEQLRALTTPPANWYERLFNSILMMMGFSVGNPEVFFMILIRHTVCCDDHWFKVTGLPMLTARGDLYTFPRVNLSKAGGAPTGVANYFVDSPHPLIQLNEQAIEAFCDKAIELIKAAPTVAVQNDL